MKKNKGNCELVLFSNPDELISGSGKVLLLKNNIYSAIGLIDKFLVEAGFVPKRDFCFIRIRYFSRLLLGFNTEYARKLAETLLCKKMNASIKT